MNPRTFLRATVSLVALGATIYGAAGVVLVCIIAGTVIFAAWELVLVALLFDLTWTPALSLHSLPWYTLLSLALLWATEPVRREFLA